MRLLFWLLDGFLFTAYVLTCSFLGAQKRKERSLVSPLTPFFFGSTHGLWKFPCQGSNLCCGCDLCHSGGDARSLTLCAKGNFLVSLPLRRHESQWVRAPPLWLHLTLITSLKILFPNTITLQVRASTQEFFWPCPWHVEVLGPGTEPAPQQWQHQTLNPLSQQGTPTYEFWMQFSP